MRKTIFTLAILTFSISSMAYEITCSGQTTQAKIVLGLTGKAFPLNKAEYSFGGKIIQASNFEFGIQGSKDQYKQSLIYKFKTLKKHSLAKKNSDLVFTIKQSGLDLGSLVFILRDDYEAELKIMNQGSATLLDKMDCQAI